MYNPFSLKGKIILVTGASSGIGRATAVECSKMGAKLVLTARNEDRLKETLNLLQGDEHQYIVADLSNEVERLGGEPSNDTTNLGKIYRVWMDLKATFTGSDRQSILESCEFGEDAAQKAYRDALASDAEIDATTRQLITSQQADLKSAHDTVKKYRDMHNAVKN